MLEIFASLQSLGSSPESMDCCMIICSMGARCTAHSFNIRLGMLSGPDALFRSTFLSSFSSPFWSILIGVMLFLACILVLGSILSVVFVNTDLNCCNSNSALPLLSLTRLDPFFNGAIPPESWRFDLTYFQKGFVLLLFKPSSMFWFMYSCYAFRRCLLHSF